MNNQGLPQETRGDIHPTSSDDDIFEAAKVAILLGAEVFAPAGSTIYLTTVRDFDARWVQVYESQEAAELALFVYVIRSWINKNQREQVYNLKFKSGENPYDFVLDAEIRYALLDIEEYLKKDADATYLSPLRTLYWQKFGEPNNWKTNDIARITLEYLSPSDVISIYFGPWEPEKSLVIAKQKIKGKEDLADIKNESIKDFFLTF